MLEMPEIDLIKLIAILVMGVSFAVVVLHASFTNKNIILWALVGLVPVLGIIIYFIIHYVQIAGDKTRRAKIHEERIWEFVLTDKGKKIDPNKKEEKRHEVRPGGVTGHVMAETPPSSPIPDDEEK